MVLHGIHLSFARGRTVQIRSDAIGVASGPLRAVGSASIDRGEKKDRAWILLAPAWLKYAAQIGVSAVLAWHPGSETSGAKTPPWLSHTPCDRTLLWRGRVVRRTLRALNGACVNHAISIANTVGSLAGIGDPICQ